MTQFKLLWDEVGMQAANSIVAIHSTQALEFIPTYNLTASLKKMTAHGDCQRICCIVFLNFTNVSKKTHKPHYILL